MVDNEVVSLMPPNKHGAQTWTGTEIYGVSAEMSGPVTESFHPEFVIYFSPVWRNFSGLFFGLLLVMASGASRILIRSVTA